MSCRTTTTPGLGSDGSRVASRLTTRRGGPAAERLDDRERFIIRNHFGLGGQDARSMANIGNELGISRERVRQIEVEALRRLRAAV